MGNTCTCYSCSSSTTENDNTIGMPDVEDVGDLDVLISYMEERVKEIEANKHNEASTSGIESSSTAGLASFIKFGNNLLENILKNVNKQACKMSFMSKLDRATRKMVFAVLKEATQMNWVGVGFCVVGYVLDQVDQVSANKDQCIHFLKYMCALAKHVMELVGHMPQEKLKEVVVFIVRGSLLCVSQMQSNSLSRFFSASVNGSDLESLQSQLGHIYPDLTLGAVIGILNKLPTVPPPSQGEHPDAVGVDERRDTVIGLLDMKEKSARAVVIYGVGGIGKTTIATAVYSRLPLKQNGYKFCRVDMEQDCNEQDLQRLQEQILKDLFGKNIEVRSCREGREQLCIYLREAATQRVFLFIDNALSSTDLEKFLPRDLSLLPEYSRILLTTRKLDETAMLQRSNIKHYYYSVNTLNDAEAMQLLCKQALGSPDARFDNSLDIDGLLGKCDGIPLVLELVGSKLREHGNNISACNNILSFLKDTVLKGEGDLSERVVGVVYDTLKEEVYKEAFLDITSFFCYHWPRRTVIYIVGEIELKALLDAALVTTDDDDNLKVHDIVRARGRRLCESNRLIDLQSFKDALQDKQKLEALKGIRLKYDTSGFQLQAEHLDLMHRSLRVLNLSRHVQVNGRCQRTFENLRYINGQFNSLPMDLNKLPRLAIFDDNIHRDVNLRELPVSLRTARFSKLNLSGALLESFGALRWLEELEIKNMSQLQILPESFGQLNSLQNLTLFKCDGLTTLPESIGNLPSLTSFDVSLCGLKNLPETFGNLCSLAEFIARCRSLESLPASMGQLKSLEYMDFSDCSNLRSLPESIGQLSRLKNLNIGGCRKLSRLPDEFGQLESLVHLNMRGCSGLETVCNDFGSLSSLVTIDTSRCPALEGSAMDKMVQMKSLMVLNIWRSPMLMKRWEEIKKSYPLLVYNENEMDTQPYYDAVSRGLFCSGCRFVQINGFDDEEVDLSSLFSGGSTKVSLLLTMSADISEDGPRIKDKLREVASQGFATIIYIYVGLEEAGQESNHRAVLEASRDTGASACAWISRSDKHKSLLAYSLCRALEQYEQDVECFRTLVATASVFLVEDNMKFVHNVALVSPWEDEMVDFLSGSRFYDLFDHFLKMEV